MQGWIKLHRKIQDSALWKQKRVFSKAEAWIDILMEVRHDEEPDKVLIKNTIIMCRQGQSIKSLGTWADRWTWTKSATRRFLDLLKRENMITIENMKKTTRLSVCNYDSYQNTRNTSETQVKRKRNASETQVNTDKNVKKDKNERKTIPQEEFIAYWNSKTKLPRITTFTKSRQTSLRVRSKEDVFRNRWREVIDNLAASKFHTGDGGRGWRAKVDWILKNDSNYVKMLENSKPKAAPYVCDICGKPATSVNYVTRKKYCPECNPLKIR